MSAKSAKTSSLNVATNNTKRHYETMFILKPTLVEEEIKARIDFFKDVITKNGGEIETCLDMGMRNLAYQIKKNHRGYYFVIYFRATPSLIAELERLYGISEDVLRFIVIKYESKSEQTAWQSLVNRANKKEKPKTLKKDDGVYRERGRYPRDRDLDSKDSQSEGKETKGEDSIESSGEKPAKKTHTPRDSKDSKEAKSE
ncbi:30S ribosomal protein S6 [Helicobacter saguini]|uniref:Small ribosomal subunit protein bS6 n=1 Tax=Helicobacter saguini TaxID=1548018 RepID=A0A347VLH5_9HELI|nr:30S ribosomal protein S6 [Helicobacter saguini]MWV67758.1 30S ribosomal protein S6 [Helicobacter saguini]MWV70774.1 30S ribosomal protein S6 [Helicobacter saguini]MWV72678.1 30S ribosomal protein S6 [Helicobacter saguini]TLD94519.1 30S ribosomal protein S6 [Helicobacter saguini]